MFRKLFAARSSRSPQTDHSRRLELESLEDRIALDAAIGGLPPGPYASGGSFSYGPGSSVVGMSDYGLSYPQILGGYGYSPESFALAELGVGLPVGIYPYPTGSNLTAAGGGPGSSLSPAGSAGGASSGLGQVGNVIGSLAALAAMETHNPQQVLNLAIDEFYQAADTFVLLRNQAQGIGNANTTSVQSFLATHEQAIAQNPAEHTPAGQMLGALVYDATIAMLASQSGGV